MQNIKQNISYAEQYNINASNYSDVLIAEFSFSMRTYNGLFQNGIKTVEQLLNSTESEVAKLKNVGSKCLEEIHQYISSLDSKEYLIASDTFKENITFIPTVFKQNFVAISKGDFLVFNNLNEDEEQILCSFKEAYEILDKELIKQCCFAPQTVVSIINMFNHFVKQNDMFADNKACLIEQVNHLPNNVQNATISYVLELSGISLETVKLEETDKSLSIRNYIFNLSQINNEKAHQLSCALKWCNFSIEKELSELFEMLYKKSNMQITVKMRSVGHTLEETGAVLGVTRERVRQIEQKSKKIFTGWNRKYKILHQISLIRSGDTVLSETELEKYFGDNFSQIIWLLKDSKGDFVYDKQLEMFIGGGEEISSRGQLFLDSLPDVFNQNKLQDFLNNAHDEWDLPTEVVKKAITENYNFTGNTYHRTRLSLTSMYTEILNKYYKSGLHIYDPKELQLFREHIKEQFGDVKLPTNDRAISARLSDIGILCNRGTYRPKEKEYLPKSVTDKIYQYISTNESPVFLMNTLFSIFEDDLLPYGIDNKYFLQGILRSLYENEFIFLKDYISKNGNVTTIHSEIVNFIKKSNFPVSKSEIQLKFPGVTDILISLAVTETGVLNYFGEYLHASKLNISTEEKAWLKSIVTLVLSDDKSHHIKEIYDIISYEREEILSRNAIIFQYRLYSLLEYLFKDTFQFSRPYISNFGVSIEYPSEVLHDFIYNENTVTISDITSFAKEINFQISSILDFLNSCNDSYLIINSKQIARLEYINIDDTIAFKVEEALLQFVDVTIPINEITNLSLLPILNIPWTDWLVYSVLNKWSTKFEVAASSNQFRMAIPLVSPIGKMCADKFRYLSASQTEILSIPDDLDDIDNLIVDVIKNELFEVNYEL